MSQLLIVEEGKRGFAETRRRLQQQGRTVVDEWRNEPGALCAGVVTNADEAGAALLAAVWGADVLVLAATQREVIERLVEDLRRLGPVEYRTADTRDDPGLTSEEYALLRFLAEGRTLGEAARQLHLSRRTADRRLASARAKIGVATTAEAIVAFAAMSA